MGERGGCRFDVSVVPHSMSFTAGRETCAEPATPRPVGGIGGAFQADAAAREARAAATSFREIMAANVPLPGR